MYNSKIVGLGKFLPENIVTNQDLAKKIDTSEEWIVERTGIEERRHIVKGDGNTTASMGAEAAKIAIERAKISANEIDLILFATLSPDYYMPGSGVFVQNILNIPTCPAMDIRNACSGFVYAIATADQFIKTGMYKNILVIGSETQSGAIDMTTRGRDIAVIFGDGAGAAVVTKSESSGSGILSSHLYSEGEHVDELVMVAPNTNKWVTEIVSKNDPEDSSYYPYMNGKMVFKNAVSRFEEVINKGLDHNSLEPENISLLIPHQANLRISQFVQRKFKLRDDQVYNNIMRYGNTTAASIPIALTEAWEEGKVNKGDLIVLAAFGAGFSWGSTVIRWE
ncbi:MAG: ketoacyl-ACP synthase III [Flavobacteriaceae bacterium]|nr:ketoacyl-ACP synthase III [Flavobacteriaceae bacterium]